MPIIVGPWKLRQKEGCSEFEKGLESELLLTLWVCATLGTLLQEKKRTKWMLGYIQLESISVFFYIKLWHASLNIHWIAVPWKVERTAMLAHLVVRVKATVISEKLLSFAHIFSGSAHTEVFLEPLSFWFALQIPKTLLCIDGFRKTRSSVLNLSVKHAFMVAWAVFVSWWTLCLKLRHVTSWGCGVRAVSCVTRAMVSHL